MCDLTLSSTYLIRGSTCAVQYVDVNHMQEPRCAGGNTFSSARKRSGRTTSTTFLCSPVGKWAGACRRPSNLRTSRSPSSGARTWCRWACWCLTSFCTTNMQVIHSFQISFFTGHVLHQQQRDEAAAAGRGPCASTSSADPGLMNYNTAVLDNNSIWRTLFFKCNRILSIHVSSVFIITNIQYFMSIIILSNLKCLVHYSFFMCIHSTYHLQILKYTFRYYVYIYCTLLEPRVIILKVLVHVRPYCYKLACTTDVLLL